MNVDRTIKLKLDLSEYDKETFRLTMSMSNHVFNEIAQYGFDHQTCSNGIKLSPDSFDILMEPQFLTPS